MGCILASFFKRFWLIFGSMLGSKIEEKWKFIKNGIEKTIEKTRFNAITGSSAMSSLFVAVVLLKTESHTKI